MINNALNVVNSVLSRCLASGSDLFSNILGVTNSSEYPLTTNSEVEYHQNKPQSMKVFLNHFSYLYEDEKASALPVKPFEISSPQASDIIVREGKFLWTLTEDNKLYVSQIKTTHAVCAGNKNVISAGEGVLQDEVLVIENRTGHYRVSFESLDYAIPHFESCDVKFKRIEKKDTLGELKRLKEQAKEDFRKSEERRDLYFRERLGQSTKLSF
ncbi:MAG: hypothetical protein ACRCRU_08540 [Vibrio sp.]|uniref:hypothetical protein n=1 Tax=Vibrio sp. TaxID=678 RepID=UPI003F34B959